MNINYKGTIIEVNIINDTCSNFEIKSIYYKGVDVLELIEFDIDYINELIVEKLFY